MRHVTVMSLSASIGLVAMFLVDFVDLFFIAQLNDPSLTAAVGYAATLLYFTFAIALGLSIAVSALAARLIGEGNEEGARSIATSAISVGVGVSVLICALVWVLAPFLIGLLGAQGETADHGVSYLRIVVLSMPISAFGTMCSFLLRAHGDARRAMTVTLTAGIVNAVLDPVFIFGFGWGLEGAAYASVFARMAMAVSALYPIIKHYGGLGPFDMSRMRNDLPAILGISVPAILTNIATPLGNSIVVGYVSPFGDSAVAGLAVIGRLTPLAFCVVFALSGAVGPIIGQNFGAQQYERVRGTLTRAMIFAGGYVLAAWLLLFAVHGFVADVFKLDAAARDIVFWFALCVAPLFIFNGSLFISNAAFNNLKRPLWSSMLNWGKNTIGVWPFVILGAVWGGAPGVIIGQALGGVLFGVLGLWLAYRLVHGYESGTVDPSRISWWVRQREKHESDI